MSLIKEIEDKLNLLDEKIDFNQKQTEALISQKKELISQVQKEIRKNDIENRLKKFSNLSSSQTKEEVNNQITLAIDFIQKNVRYPVEFIIQENKDHFLVKYTGGDFSFVTIDFTGNTRVKNSNILFDTTREFVNKNFDFGIDL